MKKLLMLVSITVLFVGCKKDDATSLELTMANVAGTYKITAVSMTSGGVTSDAFNNNAFYEACDRDDTYTFSATGNFTVVDAGVACSPPNAYSDIYTVNTAAKTITIGGDVATVTTFNSTTIVIQETNFWGISGATGTTTLTRQ